MSSARATMADDIHGRSHRPARQLAPAANAARQHAEIAARIDGTYASATRMVAATSSAVSGRESIQTRSEAIPGRFVENVDSLNSVADTWSEDRKSFRLVVPNIERGVNHAWRNKDSVACAKNLLLLVEPLLDLAAENEHHLFLIGMIVEALPFAGEYGAFQDGEAFGPGLSRAADPSELAPIEGLHLDGMLEDE